jgi:hypothetical protein
MQKSFVSSFFFIDNKIFAEHPSLFWSLSLARDHHIHSPIAKSNEPFSRHQNKQNGKRQQRLGRRKKSFTEQLVLMQHDETISRRKVMLGTIQR